MTDRSGLPLASNASQPPIGPTGFGVFAVLVSTPVWCGYCPVKMLARETQHSESTTYDCEYDAPVSRIRCALRMVCSRSRLKSSISTRTMFGLRGSMSEGATRGAGGRGLASVTGAGDD